MAESALITNDDGIEAPGLVALARAAEAAGLRVTIAAPLSEASGTGAGLTAAGDHRRVASEERVLAGLPAFGVAAHPGLIALVGCRGVFGEQPDVLLSGINRGANIGRAVLHSGTVGAALTAGIAGVRAVAFSLDVGIGIGEAALAHWDTAAAVVADAVGLVLSCPPGTVLNVNVPNVAGNPLPARWATLAEFGSVRSAVQRTDDGVIEVGVVAVATELEPGSDAALLAAGHVTVTALRSVSEDDRPRGSVDWPD
ncbi:5'/3'-nucleotidase SurE [Actinokineospora sp. NBRC 105648]|uniref:5'/3'-nucleotidase SurE n=1 Tax=Actinokineospora sp. NBRC 105648 TaxID=3032206 RepID=UPI00249FC02C|nr:5'/3'-nucleotidase SurE [Actinokineospora sp. NBRC 105648]GLZ41866.1 5'/3'-nucleotidase SurE [Actinokineospora sp. NBRC 105648]